jgi:hypothetical protein
MEALQILYDKLVATSAVTALASTRIYPDVVPDQVDLPAVMIDIVLQPTVDGTAPLQMATVSCSAWAHSEDGAHDLAAACDAVLDGYTGYKAGTWLRSLSRSGRAEVRDIELNFWAVRLDYAAAITY